MKLINICREKSKFENLNGNYLLNFNNVKNTLNVKVDLHLASGNVKYYYNKNIGLNTENYTLN